MEPYELSAVALLEAYRSGALSPVEAMRSVLGRAAAFDPHIKALYLLNAERAMAEARQSEARWRLRAPLGPLDGVPATIKDNIATKGDPTPIGTAASELVPAKADAPPAARLKEAGAIVFAKTTMPDYGMLTSGLSSFHPLTRNPWRLDRDPGGSSAGAAAAGAARMGPLHLGTDIGGSVRLPAGWCGLVGLKPSFGRVPIDPPYWGRVAGPLTRNVADAALMMATLSQPDARDTMCLPPAAIDWALRPLSLQGRRFSLALDVGCGRPAVPDVRDAVARAAARLEQAGAIVEPQPPFLTQDMLDGIDRFFRMRSWTEIKALPSERRSRILPFIVEWAEAAARFSAEQVFHGFSQIFEMRKAALKATGRFDFLLSPTAPITAYAAEWPAPSNDPRDPFGHIGFTVAFNMSEQPAASIPCGVDRDGLPIGLQIVGRRFDDVGVLSAVMAYEALRGEVMPPWPEPPASN